MTAQADDIGASASVMHGGAKPMEVLPRPSGDATIDYIATLEHGGEYLEDIYVNLLDRIGMGFQYRYILHLATSDKHYAIACNLMCQLKYYLTDLVQTLFDNYGITANGISVSVHYPEKLRSIATAYNTACRSGATPLSQVIQNNFATFVANVGNYNLSLSRAHNVVISKIYAGYPPYNYMQDAAAKSGINKMYNERIIKMHMQMWGICKKVAFACNNKILQVTMPDNIQYITG
jgi:hypothetical protein